MLGQMSASLTLCQPGYGGGDGAREWGLGSKKRQEVNEGKKKHARRDAGRMRR